MVIKMVFTITFGSVSFMSSKKVIPRVLAHQPIRFETAQSWNAAGCMGKGKIPGPPGDGNGGPSGGAPGHGKGNGGGNGKGVNPFCNQP